jgi:hypothetical protein
LDPVVDRVIGEALVGVELGEAPEHPGVLPGDTQDLLADGGRVVVQGVVGVDLRGLLVGLDRLLGLAQLEVAVSDVVVDDGVGGLDL